jgi:hypothetical protein
VQHATISSEKIPLPFFDANLKLNKQFRWHRWVPNTIVEILHASERRNQIIVLWEVIYGVSLSGSVVG